jgi:FMN phosphatase YigB (HAD superfamily)
MNPDKPLVVYIDVDDTLTRSAGTKVMPVRAVVEHAKELAKSGAAVYCWSTAGAEYARSTAQRLGIEDFFVGFLPNRTSSSTTRNQLLGSASSSCIP